MNRFGSPPIHENHSQYEGPPTSDLYEARRAGSFFSFQLTIRSLGAPSRAVAYIVTNGQRGNNPRIISEYCDFHREMLNDKAKRETEVSCPATLASPNAQTPEQTIRHHRSWALGQ